MTSSDHLETLAQTLEATGDYRVIRRLKPRPRTIPPPGTPLRFGLLVDVETTGLDPQRDEIIELAMTPFNYGLDGTVFSVGGSFQGLRQPSEPIAPEITAITGITNEMVAGAPTESEALEQFFHFCDGCDIWPDCRAAISCPSFWPLWPSLSWWLW